MLLMWNLRRRCANLWAVPWWWGGPTFGTPVCMKIESPESLTEISCVQHFDPPPHTHTLHTQKKRRHIKHPCDVKNLIFPDLNRLKWKQPLMLFLPPHVPYLSFHNLLWQKKHLPLWHQDWLNLSYLMFKSNEGEGRCGQKVLGDWQCSGVESDARSTETQMEAPLKYRWGCTVGICLEFTKCRCSINYNSL